MSANESRRIHAMSKTAFSDKSAILTNVHLLYTNAEGLDDGWVRFIKRFDISLPLAFMYTFEYAKPTPKGREAIEEAWQVLCALIDVDPEDNYTSMSELFSASPNDPLDVNVENSILGVSNAEG
jgi:hypothetical protein